MVMTTILVSGLGEVDATDLETGTPAISRIRNHRKGSMSYQKLYPSAERGSVRRGGDYARLNRDEKALYLCVLPLHHMHSGRASAAQQEELPAEHFSNHHRHSAG